MSENFGEIINFIEDVLKDKKMSLLILKSKFKEEYDCDEIEIEDETFIEKYFATFSIQSWLTESKEKVDYLVISRSSDATSIDLKFLQFIEVQEFENVPEFLQNDWFKLIQEDRIYFSNEIINNSLDDLKAYFKSCIQKDPQVGDSGENEFLDVLSDILMSSHVERLKIISSLRLKDFVVSKISLKDVAVLIKNNNFPVNRYAELQILSDKILEISSANLCFEKFIRLAINKYVFIDILNVDKTSEGKIKFKNTIISLDEVYSSFQKSSKIYEICIKCDVLHISKNPTGNSYRFKVNCIVIEAKAIIIHDEVTIDLSGDELKKYIHNDLDDESKNYLRNAGRDSTGKGLDGCDGFAGDSGGHFFIKCDSMINKEKLTLKSNGTNGSSGQKGGDGKNGEDGKNAGRSDFVWGDKKFKFTASFGSTFGTVFSLGFLDEDLSWSGEQDGLSKTFYTQDHIAHYSLMLVKGGKPTLPMNGGLKGLGGEGGLSGKFRIDITNQCDEMVKIIALNGKDGEDGFNGFNGSSGREGADAWAYDQSYRSDAIYEGFGENKKYEATFTSKNEDYSVYMNKSKKYVYIRSAGNVTSSSTATRNTQLNQKARAAHARAKPKDGFENTRSLYKDSDAARIASNITIQVPFKTPIIKKSVGIFAISPIISITFDVLKTKLRTGNLTFKEFVDDFKRSNLTSEECVELIDDVENGEAKIKDLQNTLDSNATDQLFFMHYKHIESFNKKDAMLLIMEKMSLIKLQKYKFKSEQSNAPKMAIPSKIEDQILYLKAKNEFNNNKKSSHRIIVVNLSMFFNSDNELQRSQVMKYFEDTILLFLKENKNGKEEKPSGIKNKLKDFFSSPASDERKLLNEDILLITIINKLFNHKSEIDIKVTLDEFKNDFEKIVKPNYQKDLTKLSASDTKELLNFMMKIFQNISITSFIETHLKNIGIFSQIYQEILSHVFKVKINVFVKNLNGSISIVKNDENVLTNTMYTETFNLLMFNGKFFDLEFDQSKFMKDKKTKFIAENVLKELLDWKIPDKFQNINNLLKNVISEETPDLPGSILSILKHFQAYESEKLSKVESILTDISLIKNASSILKAINTRLFHEQCEFSIKELKTIALSVLEIISIDSFMIKFFTVKFLSIEHSKWLTEIILLQVETYLNSEIKIKSKENWRKYLNGIKEREILVLFSHKLEQISSNELKIDDFNEIVENMRNFTSYNYNDLVKFKLESWKFVSLVDFWLKNYTFLTYNEEALVNELVGKLGNRKFKEILTLIQNKSEKIAEFNVSEFLKNLNTGDWIFNDEVKKILEMQEVREWKSRIENLFSTGEGQRSVDQLINLLKKNQDTSDTIKDKLYTIQDLANKVLSDYKSFENLSESTVIAKMSIETGSVADQLAIIMCVIRNKTKNVVLRHTQIISILTLWLNDQKGVMIQIGTGEGKTFIAVAFAILNIMKSKKSFVHIVTSSAVLAERDASDEINKQIYEAFGIMVGHNCDNDLEKRRDVYENCKIIYGSLGNFQRDYLLTQFHELELIKMDRFDHGDQTQTVIIDEVDSILLDKGNNILYLNQPIPGIDEIESIFSFIWQWVNQYADTKEEKMELLKLENVRKAVFENWLTIIDKDDIKEMKHDNSCNWTDQIIEKLIEYEILDDKLSIQSNFSKNLIKRSLTSLNLTEDLVANIIYYIEMQLNVSKMIKFPIFFNKFVLFHLDKWIKNAVYALILEEGREYVIDRVKDGSSSQTDANIIIMDVETGTDQKNSEWDEGLCQFLQLKHGCKISLYSLKSVFISNVSYLELYSNIYGMSGTLGTKQELETIKSFYVLTFALIPSFLPRKFIEFEAILLNNIGKWVEKIIEEIDEMFAKNRSVLVIFNSIKELKIAQKSIELGKYFKKEDISVYQRDYEAFTIGELQPKKLILATNLAGRGTDIKLNKDLKKSGGLHVIITYLASNVRIEEQAFGRASRAGDKGSGRTITHTNSVNDIAYLKGERNKEESTRLEQVSKYYKNFIKNEESFFIEFTSSYKSYSKRLDTLNDKELKILLLDNSKILWALWLDEQAKKLENYAELDVKNEVNDSFQEFLNNLEEFDNFHPFIRIGIAQLKDRKQDTNGALSILKANKITEHKDLNSNRYLETYLKIKSNSIKSNNQKRALETDEIDSLRNTIQDFIRSENDKVAHGMVIKVMKEKYRRTLGSNDGYSNQEEVFIKNSKIFTDSMMSFLGKGINHESFTCRPFGNQLVNEEFYQFLFQNKYIEKPTVSKRINKDAVNRISKKYNIDSNQLCNYLESKSGQTIESLDIFSKDLNKNVNFASRENFWKILTEKGILTDVTEYVIVDTKTLKEFSPFELEKAVEKFKDAEVNEIKFNENHQISLKSFSEDHKMLKASYKKAFLRSKILRLDRTFAKLIMHNLVKINKLATFNLAEFEKIQQIFKFEMFDSIIEHDFNFIENDIVRKRIISTLIAQNILIKDEKSNTTLNLNYAKLENIDLMGDFCYKDEICDLITSKFAFRIALESLANHVRKNVKLKKNSYFDVSLESNPHVTILHDLINDFTIELSKVNEKRVKDDFKKQELLKKYVDKSFIENYLNRKLDFQLDFVKEKIDAESLFQELINDRVLITHPVNIFVYSIQAKKINLSDEFKSLESTIQIMLDRKRMLANNKDTIYQKLLDCVAILQSDQYVNPTPILVSLKEVQPTIEDDNLNFMQLKGLGYIMQVREEEGFWKSGVQLWKSTVRYFTFALEFLVGIGIASAGFFMQNPQNLMKGADMITDAIESYNTEKFSSKNQESINTSKIIEIVASHSISMGSTKTKCLSNLPNFTFKETDDDEIEQFFEELNESKLRTIKNAGNPHEDGDVVNECLEFLKENLNHQLELIVRKFFNDNEIVDLAAQLMEQENKNDNLLIAEYQKFKNKPFKESESNIFSFSQTHFEILYKVDQMMNSHLKVKNLKELFTKLVSFGRISLTSDVQKVLSAFIVQLKRKVKDQKSPNDRIETCQKHMEELLNTIVPELLDQTYAIFHEDVTVLIVKFIGSKSTDRPSKTFLKRKKIRTQKSNQITNYAARLLNESANVVDTNEPADDDEKLSLMSKLRKIKATTVNVATFNKLAKFDFTLDETEMEAIAEIINKTLIVNFEGVMLTFGMCENFYEIPGSFSNYEKLKLKLTIKRVYQILKPLLGGSALENFHEEISNKIIKNSNLMKIKREQYLLKNLGLNGGSPYKAESTKEKN